MEEVRYMISEASKRIDVEAHVLRYWQKELDLPISRNEMDQRFYVEADIELFKKVKHFKDQGFQLKAIKMLLPNLHKQDIADMDLILHEDIKQEGKVMSVMYEEDKPKLQEGTSLVAEDEQSVCENPGEKLGQFQAVMNHILSTALKENNVILSKDISQNITEGVIKEMSFLMRIQEEKEEERFKKFDATLRDYQKSRQMTAAAIDNKSRKKSKFFKKNKVYV